MLQFEGSSEHGLDSKGRLNIPTRFRELLNDVYGTDIIKITRWKNYLRAYPLPEWENFMRKLNAEEIGHPKRRELVRHLIMTVVECPVDKQGRILLPPTLRVQAGIDKDVVVSGVEEHFEIWDKAAWEREFAEIDFDAYEEILTSAGVL